MAAQLSERSNVIALQAFIGRQRELDELRAGVAAAVAGHGGVFLLVGEPGIGKTRLAEEIAREAAAQGVHVVWGRCWEGGGAPVYWPWVQVFRALLRQHDTTTRAALLGDTAERLAPLLPEIALGAADGAPALAGEHARFALFDAVGTALQRAGSERPLLLVLDDLHAADQSSLLVLQFVARALHSGRVLILGTFRDLELQRRPECAQIVSAVAQAGHRLPLGGLSEDDVSHLLTAGLDVSPTAAVVTAVYRTTEGNPFFVDEIVRQLRAEHSGVRSGEIDAAVLHIPHGVRDAIRERLRPLSPACQQVLRVAAVIGREFDIDCLQAVSPLAAPALLDALHEATAGGVVTSTARGARHRFTHALLHETLYDDAAPSQRMTLHHQIGSVLAQRHADDSAPPWAEIAHHFLQAAPAGDVDPAVTYALRAGRQALTQFAYEEAALQFEQALAVCTLQNPPDDGQRCEVLLALGEAQLGSGRASAARETFQRAAEVARRLGSAEQCARAALGCADRGLGPPPGAADPTVVDLIEAALVDLGEEANGTKPRARLLARLASEFAVSDPERGIALSAQAVALARQLNDPITLAHTLSAQHFVLWRSDYLADRLEAATEIMQLGDRLRDPELAIQGRTWRLIDLMGMGDADRFDRELAAYEPRAARLRRPRYQWMSVNLQALRALWRGRWIEAMALAQQALPLAEHTDDPTARINPLVQVFVAQRELGQLAQQLPMLQQSAERYPTTPVPRTFLALIYSDLDCTEAARAEFERVAREDFADLRRERRLGVLPYLTEVCGFLQDRARAAILYDLLRPYAGSTLAYGASVCFGAATHYLGLLAATMAHFDEAERHFADALAHNARMQGPAWLARTEVEYAHLLLTRDRSGDRTRGRDLARQALTMAQKLDMRRLAERAQGLIDDTAAPQLQTARLDEQEPAVAAGGGRVILLPARHTLPEPRPTSANHQAEIRLQRAIAPDHGTFCIDGPYWTITYNSTVLRLKDTKGLRCLHHLLRHPGREFHALDLEAQTGVAAVAKSTPVRGAHQRQIESLRDQLEEATRFNDLGRVAGLQDEIEALSHELTATVSAHDVERARVNVTRAIKTAIKRIAEANAPLGRYLATTIRTGTLCGYAPHPRRPIGWRF